MVRAWRAGTALACGAALLFAFAPARAQDASASASKKAAETGTEQLRHAAWSMLSDAVASKKVRTRSDAVSALSILDSDPRAVRVIENELEDNEESIRAEAVASLGKMHAKRAIPALRQVMNNDSSPAVSFAAAQTLWTLGDRTGRDMLYDVLLGQRKATDGIVRSHLEQAKKDLRDPKTMALMGINEASGAFLGPFSMGVSFAEEYAKDKSAPVQAICAGLLANDNTSDTYEQLIGALADNNWIVRAAAAKALARMHRRQAIPALKEMMENDNSQPAQLMAAAAILKLTEGKRAETRVPSNHEQETKAGTAAVKASGH